VYSVDVVWVTCDV